MADRRGMRKRRWRPIATDPSSQEDTSLLQRGGNRRLKLRRPQEPQKIGPGDTSVDEQAGLSSGDRDNETQTDLAAASSTEPNLQKRLSSGDRYNENQTDFAAAACEDPILRKFTDAGKEILEKVSAIPDGVSGLVQIGHNLLLDHKLVQTKLEAIPHPCDEVVDCIKVLQRQGGISFCGLAG